jgi:thiamine pyrophosphokinase
MAGNAAQEHHALIVLGGDALHRHAVLFARACNAPIIVAADSGWRRAVDAGLTPTHLIGDMDSIASIDFDAARSSGAVIEEYPSAKDETDAEIAIITSLREGATRISLLSGNGNRPDHVFAMLHSLTSHALIGTRVDGFIGATRFEIVREDITANLETVEGDTVSLIPIGGHATVSTTGLQWELSASQLVSHESRGMSNKAIAADTTVTVLNGCVAAFITPATIVTGEEQ